MLSSQLQLGAAPRIRMSGGFLPHRPQSSALPSARREVFTPTRPPPPPWDRVVRCASWLDSLDKVKPLAYKAGAREEKPKAPPPRPPYTHPTHKPNPQHANRFFHRPWGRIRIKWPGASKQVGPQKLRLEKQRPDGPACLAIRLMVIGTPRNPSQENIQRLPHTRGQRAWTRWFLHKGCRGGTKHRTARTGGGGRD